MTTTKLKEILALDSMYILALAIGVWLPVLLMYTRGTANPFYITQTLLWGTGYLILVRAASALVLLFCCVRDAYNGGKQEGS